MRTVWPPCSRFCWSLNLKYFHQTTAFLKSDWVLNVRSFRKELCNPLTADFCWSLNLKYFHETTRNIFGSQHRMVLGHWMAVAPFQRFLCIGLTELFDLVQWSAKNGSSFTVTLYTPYRNKKGDAWQVIWQYRNVCWWNNNIWRNNTIAASWSSVASNLLAMRMNVFMSGTPL
jgi:hypothetical protein